MWETLMEAEPPSVNDQLTTSFAGAFLGEVLYRWGRAVLWGGGAHPSGGRHILAGVIDPMGAGNRSLFSEKWRRVPPPRLHAFMAAGYNQPLDETSIGR